MNIFDPANPIGFNFLFLQDLDIGQSSSLMIAARVDVPGSEKGSCIRQACEWAINTDDEVFDSREQSGGRHWVGFLKVLKRRSIQHLILGSTTTPYFLSTVSLERKPLFLATIRRNPKNDLDKAALEA